MTPTSRSGSGRRSVASLICASLAAGGLAAAGVTVLEPGAASASSHREAPLISGEPQFDNTDVYAFVSPDKPDTTTVIANWIPFEEPAGGPNFFTFSEDAQYDIRVDQDGDAQEDLIFRYSFKTKTKNDKTFLYNTGVVESLDDPDLNITQTYDIELIKLKNRRQVSKTQLADDVWVAPSNVGKASMPNFKKLRDEAVYKTASGVTTYAGQADDPFFLDLRVFDLLYGGDLSEVGRDTLKGYNVNSIALQVPSDALVESKDQPIVGIWSTTQRAGADGQYHQVSRLGMPLVNEVVNPIGDKDKFNASSPVDDAQFLKNVTEPELPKLIEAIYKIPAPKEPRNDLVDVFLKGVEGLNQPPHVTPSEQLRLNTSIEPTKKPKRLGVLDGDNQGFPNGRRLTDDVLDIALQVVEGELVDAPNDLGDAVNKNDKKFGKYFPYVGLPTAGSRGKTVQGNTTNSVRSAIGTGVESGTEDTTLIAASAGAGAGGVLLIGAGLLWWRRRNDRAYY